jgi:hypothetical protein
VVTRFGQASFAGAQSFVSCEYTCSLGISPGEGLYVIKPDAGPLQEISDLVLTDNVTTLTVPRCKIYDFDVHIGSDGQYVTLRFYDRRAFWEFPTVSGSYNQPQEQTLTVPVVNHGTNPQGNPVLPPPPPPDPKEAPIKPWTEKKLPELARLCLEAMGEKNYDVSALDPNATPTVDWEEENAARALNQLCEDHGCVVAYRPGEDRVVVCRQGEGKSLPEGAFLEAAPALKIPDTPDKITLVGAYREYQVRFELEPVAEDFDGSYVTLDKLSYRPADGGLKYLMPPTFPGIQALTDATLAGIIQNNPWLPGTRTLADALALARRSVWRYYRITLKTPDGLGNRLVIPPDSKKRDRDAITRRDQVRLLPKGVVTCWDDLGKWSTCPARVFGKHLPKHQGFGTHVMVLSKKTTYDTEVKIPFCFQTISTGEQLVVFDDYVYYLNEDGTTAAPTLVLECACNVADPKTFALRRYHRTLDLKLRRGIGPAKIVREDVQWKAAAQYGTNSQFKTMVDNAKAVEPRADYYLRGELRNYGGAQSDRKSYPGFLDVSPDGAVYQITWSCGGGDDHGARTEASFNHEHNKYLPAYAARRRLQETNLDAVRRDKERSMQVRVFLKGPAAFLRAGGAG